MGSEPELMVFTPRILIELSSAGLALVTTETPGMRPCMASLTLVTGFCSSTFESTMATDPVRSLLRITAPTTTTSSSEAFSSMRVTATLPPLTFTFWVLKPT